jgi:membrane-associated phospholipid phosphatase
MISVPNFGGLSAKVYGPGFRLLAPNHLYYFTKKTLKKYLIKSGFQLLRIEYPYWGTDYSMPLRHAAVIALDWLILLARGKSAVRLSPPFFGNVMRVLAKRED